jgi:hypothetical protein
MPITNTNDQRVPDADAGASVSPQGLPDTGSKAPTEPGEQNARVQSDTLLSQPDANDNQGYGPVGEEISLDQQSDSARQVGHIAPEGATTDALAQSIQPDSRARDRRGD